MGIDEKIETFFQAYSSNFGRMTAADGAEHYNRWLRGSTVNIDAAINAVESLGRNWDGKFKPKMGKIKQAMSDTRYEDREYTKSQHKYVRPDCDECKNSGLIMIVFEEGKEATKFPCPCPRGIAHNDEIFGRPKTFEDYYQVAKALKAGWSHKKHSETQKQEAF